MIGYSYFFGKPPEEMQKQNEITQEATQETFPSSESGSTEKFGSFDTEPTSINDINAAPKGALVTVDTPLYTGVIDTVGARVISWELKNYKASTNGDDSELVNLFNDSHPGFNALLQVKGLKIPEFITYQYDGMSNVSVSEGTKELTFRWISPEGITIKNIYEIDSSSYLVKQTFEIANSSGNSIQERVVVRWPGQVKSVGMRGGDGKNFIVMVSDSVERVDSNPGKTISYKGVINWFGFSEKYFMSTFLPETGAETVVELVPTQKEELVKAQFAYPVNTISSGKSSLRTWEVYMGPLESSFLTPVGYGLDKAINYGWFGFLAKPMLKFLEWLNDYFHNYGVSIIVLTIIIRVLFFPLTVKSMVSMKKLQMKTEKVKPEMDALKEKYKDDKTKQNTELMALYSKHGINPLGQLGGLFTAFNTVSGIYSDL